MAKEFLVGWAFPDVITEIYEKSILKSMVEKKSQIRLRNDTVSAFFRKINKKSQLG